MEWTTNSPCTGRPKQGQAVVVGASVAGLLAGRVLADYFDKVVIIDKERLDGGTEPRKAVPQGNHIHAILTPAFQTLQRFVPDVIDDLLASGAHLFDGGKDWKFHIYGSFLAKGETGRKLIGSSRPFFEDHLRRKVMGLENVEIKNHHTLSSWVTDQQNRRVIGITAKTETGTADLEADLAIDARGRASTFLQELSEFGYQTPTEEIVGVDLGYTSRIYRADHFSPDWHFLLLNPSVPDSWIGGLIEKIENDSWIVTQFGYFGYHAPADDEGFLSRARELGAPDIAEFLEIAEPVSDFHQFGTRQCRMLRYEELDAFPDRMLVIGDAVCSLNPIYGQGMTKAAREAGYLWDTLADHFQQTDTLDGFGDKFRRGLPAAGAEWAWQLTTGADLGYPQTTGNRKTGGALMGWYMKQLFKRASASVDARRRLFDTLMLVSPPSDLMKPVMIRHALGF